MTKDDIEGIFRAELASADAYNQSELDNNRSLAMQYYTGQPRGDELPGRSKVQSLDVADQVNAVWAQIQKAFSGIVVDFPPMSQEDEQQAEAEGDFVQHSMNESNAWRVMNLAVFDALLKRNGWLKVWVDEDTVEIRETISKADPVVVGMALAEQEGQTVEITDEDESQINIVRTLTRRELKFRAVDPRRMRFSEQASEPDLSDMRFVSEEEYFTRSELVEMGHPKELVWELRAQRDMEVDDGAPPQTEPAEAAQEGAQTIRCNHCYLQLATEQGGTTRLYYGFMADETLLSYEPVEIRPYVTGSAIPMPHRVSGQSMFDLLREVQDSKTFTLRQWMDNLNIANNTKLVCVKGEVDMQSALNSRPGGVIMVESPQAVTPILSPDVGPSCQAALDYQDNIRTERGGAALDLMRGEMQVAQSSALAAAQEYSAKEQMALFYTANIVHSLVRGAFLLTHETMRLYMPGTIRIKRRGEWAETDPSQWPARRTVKIVAGMSNSDKLERVAGLTQVIQQQMALIQAGAEGVLTDYSKLYGSMADWIRTYNLGDPSEYLINPLSQEAQQAMQAKAQEAQQQQQQMAQMQAKVEEFERWKHASELQFKYYAENLDAERDEAKITAQAVDNAESNAIEMVKLSQAGANGQDRKESAGTA